MKQSIGDQNSFEVITREWHVKFKPTWSENYAAKTLSIFENNVSPWMGLKNINEITVPEILATLRRVESRGTLETAHRINQLCGQVFRYAIATGRAERDPSANLRGVLPPAKSKHYPSIY